MINTTYYLITSPLQNLSVTAFIFCLDIVFEPELHPTRNSHFQKLRLLRFSRIYARERATIILFTNIMHLVISCILLKDSHLTKYEKMNKMSLKITQYYPSAIFQMTPLQAFQQNNVIILQTSIPVNWDSI